MSETTLAAALISAQATAERVPHDKQTEFGPRYHYSSAEAIIHEARQALCVHGLAVRTTSVEVLSDLSLLSIRRVLIHESGETLEDTMQWPYVITKGRPADKAIAGALTNSLAYYLRDLLLLTRGGPLGGEMDARDDTAYEPKGKVTPMRSKPKNGRAKHADNNLKERILTGANQLANLELTTDETTALCEITSGDYNQVMLAKLRALYGRVKARLGAEEGL